MSRDQIAAALHDRCLGEWETEPYSKEINHDVSAHYAEADAVIARRLLEDGE